MNCIFNQTEQFDSRFLLFKIIKGLIQEGRFKGGKDRKKGGTQSNMLQLWTINLMENSTLWCPIRPSYFFVLITYIEGWQKNHNLFGDKSSNCLTSLTQSMNWNQLDKVTSFSSS